MSAAGLPQGANSAPGGPRLGVMHGRDLWAEGRRMARVPLGEAGRAVTAYPFILILGQDDNERIMGARLRDSDPAVHWATPSPLARAFPSLPSICCVQTAISDRAARAWTQRR